RLASSDHLKRGTFRRFNAWRDCVIGTLDFFSTGISRRSDAKIFMNGGSLPVARGMLKWYWSRHPMRFKAKMWSTTTTASVTSPVIWMGRKNPHELDFL